MDTIDSITIIAAAWGLLVLRLTVAFILWPHGTQKVLGWLKGRIPDELLEKLSGLPPIVIDVDELNGALEKQIAPYQEILAPTGYAFHIDFEDIYCAGAYFLSIAIPN